MLMNSPTVKSLNVTNPDCYTVLTKAVPFPTSQVSLCSLPSIPDNLPDSFPLPYMPLYQLLPQRVKTLLNSQEGIAYNMKQKSAGLTKHVFDFHKQPKQKKTLNKASLYRLMSSSEIPSHSQVITHFYDADRNLCRLPTHRNAQVYHSDRVSPHPSSKCLCSQCLWLASRDFIGVFNGCQVPKISSTL